MKAAIVLAAVLLSPWAASTVLTAAGVRIQFEKSLLGTLPPPREPVTTLVAEPPLPPPPRGWREDLYLAANPDVAGAVAAGVLPTGFAHYHRFGRAEGRLLAPLPVPADAPRPVKPEPVPLAVAAAEPAPTPPADAAAGPVVRTVRFGHHPGFVRVVLETTGPVIAHPVRADGRTLAVELAGCGWTAPRRGADRKVGPLLSYSAETAGSKARLVLRAERAVTLRQSFALPPDGDRGHRIVFDLAVEGAS